MKYTGTLRSQQPTSSTDKEKKVRTINLHAPQAWNELTQQQLRYVLWLLVSYADPTEIKTLMFCRFCGIEVIKKTRFGWRCRIDDVDGAVYLKTWQVQSFIHQFDYIDSYEDMDCRLDAVCGLKAAGVMLTDLSLGEYLNAEKYYQAYFINDRKDTSFLEKLGRFLYKGDTDDWHMDETERLGTLLWFSYVKSVMAQQFPNFFKKTTDDDGESVFPDIIEQYNIQVRALTGGDVTKEPEVLATPCWRALTELDAKAREAAELEKLRKKK